MCRSTPEAAAGRNKGTGWTSVPPKEIIVIDDGSTDNTETIISENYLTREPHRIIYVKKSNGGAASARNLGIKKAKGEFILMLDADDQLDPYSREC
ncbi:MAG: glycosyltransferase family A protein [Desulfobacteraceae bacterium]